MKSELESSSAGKRWWAFGAVAVFFCWIWFRTFSGELDRSLASWTWLASRYTGVAPAFVVIAIFAGMIWWWSHLVRDEQVKPSYWGLVWLVLGMIIYWVGVRIIQPRLALIAMPLLTIGFAHYCWGGKVARMLAPAAFYLLFLIPVPGLEIWLANSWGPTSLSATIEVAGWFGIECERVGRGLIVSGAELHLASR